MGADVLHVDAATDQSSERRVGLGVAVDRQTLVGQITDARRETEAQQMHQREHVVGEASRVGVVLLDTQVRLVVEQAVQYMSRIAHGGIVVLWLSATGFNLWVGVNKAGYSFSEEIPIMALLFLLPAAASIILKWKIL